MIDVNKLLTAVFSGGAPMAGREASPPGGALSDQAAGLFGAQRGGAGDFLSGKAATFGGGALVGGLAGVLLNSKHARRFAGSALQVGAAAVVGGLAYKAYQDYRAGRPIVPQGVQDAFRGVLPAGAGWETAAGGQPPALAAPVAERTASLLLRAAIAATTADGRIDDVERQRLIAAVEAGGLSQEERRYLEEMIARPDTPAMLAAQVTSPDEAGQVYLAAFMAIDADTPVERAWLDMLAAALALDPAARARLEATANEDPARLALASPPA
jgi:uncharacterized membrane protein YebE (DUF533 family)